MNNAYILVRQRAGYPHEAIMEGARAAGYMPHYGFDRDIGKDDLLITWTPWRNSIADRAGERHQENGGKWIVCENGYLGLGQTALGLGGYNGWGDHRNGGSPPDRFDELKQRVFPWREDGRHILLIGQAGGTDGRFTPATGWVDEVVDRISALTDRPIIYRPKPRYPRMPEREHANFSVAGDALSLGELLRGAWATVVYTSKVGVASILAGVPVLYCGPRSVLSNQYGPGLEKIEAPPVFEREPWLWDLAYAQWSPEEIALGEPFKRLLA